MTKSPSDCQRAALKNQSVAALRDLNEKLLDAAKHGDSQELRLLLEAGADKAGPHRGLTAIRFWQQSWF